MKNKLIKLFLFVVVIPLVAVTLLALISFFIIKYIQFPPCMFYKFTGIYCPGCGATRAVNALLHGDIMLSLRQNPIIIISLFFAVLLYIEPVVKALCKKDFRSPVRNFKVLTVVLIVWFIYNIIRNFVPALAPIIV